MSKRKWSKQRVIEAIRQRHRRGLPMGKVWKEEPALYDAAKRYLGCWRKALAAARLAVKPTRKFTRQEVIKAIESRHRQGMSLTNVWREDKPLYAAAKKHFDLWSKALAAAGFQKKVHRRWSRQIVIKEIQARYQQGASMRNVSRHDGALCSTAYSYFGSWNNALVAAGLEPTEKRWSKQRVIDEILAWSKRDSPKCSVWKDSVGLASAAKRYCGGRNNAMVAAGLEPRPQEKWSKERVIKELHVLRGDGLHGNALREKHPKLIAAAGRHFGGMKNALSAAGLEPICRGKWSRTRVVKELQNRHIRGLPLHGVRVQRSSLASAAHRHFHAWSDALVAAGLLREDEKPRPKMRWSKERVMERIKARYDRGLPMTNIGRDDMALALAARKHFRNWRSALVAAGLGSEWIPTKKWSKQRVIGEIRERARRGRSLSSGRSGSRPLVAAAGYYLGGWRKALAAAGITPEEAQRTYEKKPNEG